MKKKQDLDGFQVGGARATYVLVICSLLYAVNYMDRQVLSVVLEPMKLDLGLTDAQAGWIQTAFLLSIGLSAIPISYWTDRWSRKKTLGLMALVWSALTFATGLGRNFLGVLVPRLLTGVGEAGFSAAGTALITASYPEGVRARKLGIFNMFIVIGAAGGVVMGGYLSAHHGGWRTPFFVFAVPGVILGFLAFFMQDYQTVSRRGPAESGSAFMTKARILLATPTLRWLYLGYGMHIVMAFSIMIWMPALLMRRFEVGEDVSGAIIGAWSLFGMLGAPLGGLLADRWQRRHPAGRMRFAAVMQLFCSLAIWVALFCSFIMHQGAWNRFSPWHVIGAVSGLFISLASIAGIPAIGATTQAVVTPDLKSLSWGLAMFFMYFFGGAWSPAVTGYLSDYFGGGARGLTMALLITGSFGLAACACWWQSSRHYQEDARRASAAAATP